MAKKYWLAGLGLLVIFVGVNFGQPPDKKGDADKNVEAVREYLKKNYPGKKWQAGPKAISNEALTKAFGEQARFYYVFSAPPLPPGAALPDLIKAYQEKYKDWQKNHISVTVKVDADGKIMPLKSAKDFNQLLKPVKTEKEAKLATAAVISLVGSGRVAPGDVKEEEVKIVKTPKGFQGHVNRKNNFVAVVHFDEKGQIARIAKTFAGPLPP